MTRPKGAVSEWLRNPVNPDEPWLAGCRLPRLIARTPWESDVIARIPNNTESN